LPGAPSVQERLHLYPRGISLRFGYRTGARRSLFAQYLGTNILGSGFDFDLIVHTGAGAYECGEESALMDRSKQARLPAIKPPSCRRRCTAAPTIINNVEPQHRPGIILEGGEKYAQPRHAEKWRHAHAVRRGHVNKPGIYEVPLA